MGIKRIIKDLLRQNQRLTNGIRLRRLIAASGFGRLGQSVTTLPRSHASLTQILGALQTQRQGKNWI